MSMITTFVTRDSIADVFYMNVPSKRLVTSYKRLDAYKRIQYTNKNNLECSVSISYVLRDNYHYGFLVLGK